MSGQIISKSAEERNHKFGGHAGLSFESKARLNGKALHGRHVTLASLYHYLAPKVSDAASLDNRDQNPQMLPDNLPQDLRITLR